MKKQNFSTLVKKSIFSLGFTSLMLTGLATSASASTTDTTPTPTPAVKYVGSLDGQPVFKVELSNENGKPQFLTIKDDQGVVLYSEKIKSKQFSKSFKFENSDRDNVKLTFILEGDKGVQSQEFKVNTNTRVYNDVVVTTL
jgi:biopolymer transport protein ExbD